MIGAHINTRTGNMVGYPTMIPERLHYFVDRGEAGRKLALALEPNIWRNPLILAIPPGGAEVGREVARFLDADFSIIGASPLPSPWTRGLSFGAVAEDGSTYLRVNQAKEISPDVVDSIIKEQLQGIRGSARFLREGRDLPEIYGRHVILVDDCLIVGSTMKAALLLCRKKYASRITVAVPVAGRKELEEIHWLADDVIAVEEIGFISEATQFYAHGAPPSIEGNSSFLRRGAGI